MVLDEYEKEMEALLEEAKLLDLDELNDGNVRVEPGNVYVIFAAQTELSDDNAFRIIGDILGIWNRDARDAHHHSWRLFYNNATLLVVGVPASKYSSHFPGGSRYIYDIEESAIKDLELQEYWHRLEVPLLTHKDSVYIPVGSKNISLFANYASEEEDEKKQGEVEEQGGEEEDEQEGEEEEGEKKQGVGEQGEEEKEDQGREKAQGSGSRGIGGVEGDNEGNPEYVPPTEKS
ncbi:hypothetical protein SK128_004063 [Halocaridina rubra]|uniref:Uncharacterized protein n=1 Tax=Halocaridina rubra TaxID=373956 RepID=A0AAN8WH20_HALRR